jgi:hypothetical protein
MKIQNFGGKFKILAGNSNSLREIQIFGGILNFRREI